MPDDGEEMPKKQGYREIAGTGKKLFLPADIYTEI
jgi:hypothetical protein